MVYLYDKLKLNILLNLGTVSSHYVFIFFQLIDILIICFAIIKISNIVIGKYRIKSRFINESKQKTLAGIIKGLVKVIVVFMAICKILPLFGINIGSIIAVASIGSLAIGFASQSLVKDFITGAFIIVEDQFNVGDLVVVGDTKGIVESINMRITKIRSADGGLHIIPNGSITSVTSMSKEFSRAILDIGVEYEADIQHVLDVLEEEMKLAVNCLEDILIAPEILGVSEFKESCVNIKIIATCKPATSAKVERELRLLVKKRFAKENISLPCPRRVVQMIGNSSN